jgi:superfamily II DNA or RNA helicase
VAGMSDLDHLGLRPIVGDLTFLRGYDYAQQGHVARIQRLDGAHRLLGQVRGSSHQSYTTLVTMTVDPKNGLVTDFSGRCNCPVSINCKHAVALVLAAAATPDRAVEAAIPPWELTLAAIIGDPEASGAAVDLRVGLLFELTSNHPSRPQRSAAVARTSRAGALLRLGLRPVIRSADGRWARTGISWSSISTSHYGSTGLDPTQLRILNDLVGLNAADQIGSYYGRQETWIYLDSLGSPRIWDLLGDARDAGLALVRADKANSPVLLRDQAATFALDVSRTETELVLAPLLDLGDADEPAVAHQLLGDPAHGVLLWPAHLDPARNLRDLPWSLARLGSPLSHETHEFLTNLPAAKAVISIPAQDEVRFLRDYYPHLRRKVTVVSRDGSVELPEDHSPLLSLVIKVFPDHRAELSWGWVYGSGDLQRTMSLWPTGFEPHRDLPFEQQVLKTLPSELGATDALLEEGPVGPRLAPTAWLSGLALVGFLNDALPILASVEHLDLQIAGVIPDYRAAEEEPIITVTSAPTEDRDWFDLAVTVTVGGEDVPFQHIFAALARHDSYLILTSGTYFSLEHTGFQRLRDLIDEARSLQDAPDKGLRINRYQSSLWDELEALGVVSAQTESWLRSMNALQDHDTLTTQPVPAGLAATLRPYQQTGFDWLSFLFDHGLGGVLADDMGLGKTIQTLALICRARESNNTDAPFLVITPTSVVGNWVSECHKFAAGLRVVAIKETRSRRHIQLPELVAGADIIITSYALFRLEFPDYQDLEWSGLILDEAQFVKNHQSKAHQCARLLATPFKLAITGTPMENNLMELWSLVSIAAPGLFPSPKRFADYYQRPIEKGLDGDRLSQLRRRIGPFMLRRTKQQVVTDLPPKQEQVIELEMHPRHRRVYETHLQRERQKVLGMIDDLDKNRFAIFRSLTLLRQLSLDAGLIDEKYDNVPSTKLDALMGQLADIIAEGHRVLVFSQFTSFLAKVRQRLDAGDIEYCYLDGKTRNRPQVLEDFRTGTAPVFLISLKAGGFGLNLTEADYCIILDPWWNPASEAQAVDRTHRIGQTKKVTVYRLVAKGTIEEKVMELKAHKSKLFDAVMAEDGAVGTRSLTAGDIRELLA